MFEQKPTSANVLALIFLRTITQLASWSYHEAYLMERGRDTPWTGDQSVSE